MLIIDCFDLVLFSSDCVVSRAVIWWLVNGTFIKWIWTCDWSFGDPVRLTGCKNPRTNFLPTSRIFVYFLAVSLTDSCVLPVRVMDSCVHSCLRHGFVCTFLSVPWIRVCIPVCIMDSCVIPVRVKDSCVHSCLRHGFVCAFLSASWIRVCLLSASWIRVCFPVFVMD